MHFLLKPDHNPLENKRILTCWTTGMDQKSKLVRFEELWMQTHPTYCQDLSPRPGRSARHSEAGGAPVNIYSIWRDRVGSRVAMEVIIGIPGASEQMNRKARVFERGTQTPVWTGCSSVLVALYNICVWKSVHIHWAMVLIWEVRDQIRPLLFN